MHSRGFVHTFEIDAEHRLHIYVGSITEVTADALVSSDDNYLSAGGGVSAAIASAAGVGIRDIYQRVVSTLKSTVGDVVRTVAGALNARHLYHAITIDFDTQEMMNEAGLRRLVGNIVESAKEDCINSLAMPALGTGAAFFQLERAAPVIISELLRRLTETRISDVTLALVDSDATRVFYEELLRAQTDAVAVRALRHREEGLRYKTSVLRESEFEPSNVPQKSDSPPKAAAPKTRLALCPSPVASPKPRVLKVKMGDLTDPFLVSQRDRLFQLRETFLESMQSGVTDTLHQKAVDGEGRAFESHQFNPEGDAYDRDFALSLLSPEQDALYEIEEALMRMELGSYGICEMSGKHISRARLEALPFARYTVECQSEVERQKKLREKRVLVAPHIGLGRETGGASGTVEAGTSRRAVQANPETIARPSQSSGVVEQFPNLVDEVRLATAPPNRPKLVEGLAALILNHAPESEVETELLTHPACRGFRGTVRQRLIEFLYISENHHRKALGAALFRNRDLRCMLGELEEAHSHLSTDEELATAILRCLCFNTLAPPTGMRQHIQNVEAQMEASRDIRNTTDLDSVGNQTGQILERFLHELIALYSCLFWGPSFEEELITRKMLDKNSARSLSTTTVGKAWEVITGITKALNKEQSMQEVWSGLGRTERLLLPRTVKFPGSGDMLNTEGVLRDVEAWRRASVHDRPDTSAPRAGTAQRDDVVLPGVSVLGRTGASSPDLKDIPKLEKALAEFHAFLCACRAGGFYPDVLRYEGTFENRDGERFVHFLDEAGKERKVRTDEKIDPRRHYYCFATNNPVHLWPVLIPKL